MKRWVVPVAAVVAVVLVGGGIALAGGAVGGSGGRSDDGSTLSSQYKGVAGSGYVSGDGSLITIAPDQRAAAPRWSAKSTAGDTVSSSSFEGEVAVINFWYAACPPCRAEAPALKDLAGELTPQGVRFLGVNVRDTASIADGFTEKFGLDYPTVLDDSDNALQLAFAGVGGPSAVPTTLVLDEQGRVAARFSGEIESPSVLLDVVSDVRAGR